MKFELFDPTVKRGTRTRCPCCTSPWLAAAADAPAPFAPAPNGEEFAEHGRVLWQLRDAFSGPVALDEYALCDTSLFAQPAPPGAEPGADRAAVRRSVALDGKPRSRTRARARSRRARARRCAPRAATASGSTGTDAGPGSGARTAGARS